MAIDPRLNVDGPEEITVTLIRADKLETSDTFRTFFEVGLAICAMIGGHILSVDKIPFITWAFLTCALVGTSCSLWLSIKHRKVSNGE